MLRYSPFFIPFIHVKMPIWYIPFWWFHARLYIYGCIKRRQQKKNLYWMAGNVCWRLSWSLGSPTISPLVVHDWIEECWCRAVLYGADFHLEKYWKDLSFSHPTWTIVSFDIELEPNLPLSLFVFIFFQLIFISDKYGNFQNKWTINIEYGARLVNYSNQFYRRRLLN